MFHMYIYIELDICILSSLMLFNLYSNEYSGYFYTTLAVNFALHFTVSHRKSINKQMKILIYKKKKTSSLKINASLLEFISTHTNTHII